MAQSVIGALRVTMGLDTAQFDRGIKQTQTRMGRLRQDFRGLAVGSVAAFSAGLGLATAHLRSFSNRADETIKAARGIGLTAEELSRLRLAADRSGFSFEQLMTSMRTFNRSIADLAAGETNTAAEALRRLGIEARNADGSLKSSRQLLGEVADAFQALPPGIERSNAVMEIFGSRNAAMINLLAQGSEGLREFDREADRLGQTISTETAKAAESFNDDITAIRENFDGFVNDIWQDILPALAAFTDKVEEGMRRVPEFQALADLDLLRKQVASLDRELAPVQQRMQTVSEMLGHLRRNDMGGTRSAQGLARQQNELAASMRDLLAERATLTEQIAQTERGLEKEKSEARKREEAARDREKAAREREKEASNRIHDVVAGARSSLPAVTSANRESLPGLLPIPRNSPLFGEIEEAEAGLNDLGVLAERAGENIAAELGYGFESAIRSAESFGDAFKAIAVSAIATIGNSLIRYGLSGGGGVGGGGLLGALSSGIGSLFGGGSGFSIASGNNAVPIGAGLGIGASGSLTGFRTGGGFQVSGHGGPDSEVVAFRASPGEHVSVDRGDGGGGRIMRVSVDVSGANGDAEIQRRVQQGVAEGLKQYDQRLPSRILDVQRRHY